MTFLAHQVANLLSIVVVVVVVVRTRVVAGRSLGELEGVKICKTVRLSRYYPEC